MSRVHTLDSNTNFMWFFLFKVVEDGYEFFAKRQLVTLFSAPNYCGEFDNAGGMMSVDETLMCSFQVSFWWQSTYKSRQFLPNFSFGLLCYLSNCNFH